MTLPELIRSRKGPRTYADLQRDSGGALTPKNLERMVNRPLLAFPDVATLRGLAVALGVPEGVVVDAAAESLGLHVDHADRH